MKIKTISSKFLITVLTLATTLSIAACSGKDSGSSQNSSSEVKNSDSSENVSQVVDKPDSEYPITIEHALGETIIEKKPERIATIAWANQDVVLALNVVPVGFSEANFGVKDDSGLLPWTKEKLEELKVEAPNVFRDTDGLDFEAIADSKPDVILAAYSGVTQEDYDLLSEIAPVIVYKTGPWATTWREQIKLNSAGMGMVEEGEELISDLEKLIEQKASEYPQIKDKKIVWANFSVKDLSKFHIYTPVDPRVAFLEELGLQFPESISNLIEDKSSYSWTISAENIELLNDVDIIIGYGSEELLETLQADEVLSNIPAIKNGAVYFIASDSDLAAAGTPGPLSIPYTIDEYVSEIAKAADKVNG